MESHYRYASTLNMTISDSQHVTQFISYHNSNKAYHCSLKTTFNTVTSEQNTTVKGISPNVLLSLQQHSLVFLPLGTKSNNIYIFYPGQIQKIGVAHLSIIGQWLYIWIHIETILSFLTSKEDVARIFLDLICFQEENLGFAVKRLLRCSHCYALASATNYTHGLNSNPVS